MRRSLARSDSCGTTNRYAPPIPLGFGGISFEQMPYQPSKEHLDKQIPEAIKAINDTLKSLSESTGADERYISLMLDALARQWENKSSSREGFGFR